ncbi:PREDICTED: probable phosphatase 2C [Prunus dulcis]|uniref:PREDICTED: probable phosphatase 2C n=1 Tax=Prunus dulcis TaxID=3755 RepID=A0A5E4F0X3_PRUDU|nr:PREDICTED: probable phosphatase 2C [Prunus dulcis]
MGNMENNNINTNNNNKQWPLQCEILHNQTENLDKETPLMSSSLQKTISKAYVRGYSGCRQKTETAELFPFSLRSGEWSHIGGRTHMEYTHICVGDLANKFGYNVLSEEAISFYGVFDGYGGKDAAQFVRDNLPRVVVEDADFPLELEKVITRSLLVANAGDWLAVLSRCGAAVEMSKDHRPCCTKERMRIESLVGYIDDGYLNGQLGVTRALELKLMTLTKDDEFLIIGSDGIWDVFTSQNAVAFARRRPQEDNDVKLCCKEIIEEAIKRGASDNLTLVMVSFHLEPPPHVVVERSRVRRSISAEGLQNLKFFLEG